MVQFNSHSTGQDLVTGIHFNCSTDATSYHINDMTRNANYAYMEFIDFMQGIDDTFQIDDRNNTTLPISTTDIVSGQQDYTLDDKVYEVIAVELKNADGNWSILEQTDIQQIKEKSNTITDYEKNDGTPAEYDIIGRSLMMYPAPNFNSTAGLKLHYLRGATLFDTTDTTDTPGFADKFHEFIEVTASLRYCERNKAERVSFLQQRQNRILRSVERYVARRNKDNPNTITMGAVNYV